MEDDKDEEREEEKLEEECVKEEWEKEEEWEEEGREEEWEEEEWEEEGRKEELEEELSVSRKSRSSSFIFWMYSMSRINSVNLSNLFFKTWGSLETKGLSFE